MSNTFRIRKGVDIKLIGEADKTAPKSLKSDVYAIKPADFHGVIPKLLVKQDATVKAGTPIFYEKSNDRIKFVSPISGKITDIVRGEKRRILEIRIQADGQDLSEDFGSVDPKSLSREQLIEKMLNCGLWPMVQQRPFAIMADPADRPKGIFISGFDSSPLAPDSDVLLEGRMDDFQAGIDALQVLAGEAKVYLGKSKNNKVFDQVKGAEINTFNGPHPAGNVGVQIHKVSPINKGEVVWTLNIQDVANIGATLKTGKYTAKRRVAVTGSRATTTGYVDVTPGVALKSICDTMINMDNTRLISGNVLTGTKTGPEGYLGFFDQQITAIPEGNEPQFLLTTGWLGLGFDKFSLSRSFPSWLTPNKKYNLNTNTNGEERAFVVTGEYDKVFPFDIYPVQLIKSIMVNDIEMMENLGIYEVAPEDFALCEYACTSKIPVQATVREGLDNLRSEFN